MHGIQKKLYISLLLSLIGITSIYILSLYIQPVEVTADKLKDFYGRYVKIRGLVKEVSFTESDHQIITILDAKGKEVQIFSWKVVNLSKGDAVVVEGIVEKYMGKWEIVTNGKIRKISSCSEHMVTLAELAAYPCRFVNSRVKTVGFVKSASSWEFILTDGKNHAIHVLCPSQKLNFGEHVEVYGDFLYSRRDFSYFILAEKVERIE